MYKNMYIGYNKNIRGRHERKILMNEFTDEVLKKVPDLYTQDGKGFESYVYIRVEGINDWVWYITEYSPEEKLFFAYVCGFENEWGYVSLEELADLVERGYATIMSTEKMQLKDCI